MGCSRSAVPLCVPCATGLAIEVVTWEGARSRSRRCFCPVLNGVGGIDLSGPTVAPAGAGPCRTRGLATTSCSAGKVPAHLGLLRLGGYTRTALCCASADDPWRARRLIATGGLPCLSARLQRRRGLRVVGRSPDTARDGCVPRSERGQRRFEGRGRGSAGCSDVEWVWWSGSSSHRAQRDGAASPTRPRRSVRCAGVRRNRPHPGAGPETPRSRGQRARRCPSREWLAARTAST